MISRKGACLGARWLVHALYARRAPAVHALGARPSWVHTLLWIWADLATRGYALPKYSLRPQSTLYPESTICPGTRFVL